MKRELLLKIASKAGITPWYGWRETIDVEHRYWVEIPVESSPDVDGTSDPGGIFSKWKTLFGLPSRAAGQVQANKTEVVIKTEIKEVVVADPTVADMPGKDGWTWKDATPEEWEAAYVAATEKVWESSKGATDDEATIELEYMREHIWRLPDDVLAALEAAK